MTFIDKNTSNLQFYYDVCVTVFGPYIYSDHDQKTFENQYLAVTRQHNNKIKQLELTDDEVKELVNNAISDARKEFN